MFKKETSEAGSERLVQPSVSVDSCTSKHMLAHISSQNECAEVCCSCERLAAHKRCWDLHHF